MGETQGPDRKSSFALPEPPTPSGDSVSSFGRDDGDGSEQRPKRARRMFLTQNACQRCRQKKSKCDGIRPTCGRCEKHGAECVYDVAQEGLTRMQNLQQQLESRTESYNQLQRLFVLMQQCSDQDASAILARLRLGAGVDDLLQFTETSVRSSSRNPNAPGPSQFPRHQQPAYGQGWSQSPVVDPGGWNPWQHADGGSTGQSAEMYDENPPPSMRTREYDDLDAPHDPFYHPGMADRPPSQHQSQPPQWQGMMPPPDPRHQGRGQGQGHRRHPNQPHR